MNGHGPKSSIGAEVRRILFRGRQVWRLTPAHHKWALGAASVVTFGVGLCNTAIPLLLGRLVDGVQNGLQQGYGHAALYGVALGVLGLIAGAYVMREGLNVLRRYLVENTCTRVNRVMSVRLASHMLKVDLGALSKEKIGTLHGRIFRSVDGFVRFLRIGFLDFFPALFTGALALVAAILKQPWLGLAMIGVIPAAVLVTVRQLQSQKGVRLGLMRACEEIDGAVVEQLGGIEYVRAAHTHYLETRRLARATERRRIKEIRHHFQMALFGCAKALNEGFFHIVVLAGAIFLAVNGQVTFGDVLTFSILYLNVMAPLAEIHRVLDEGHEASLRVADLLEMLAEPVDPSFTAKGAGLIRLTPGAPAIEIEDLQVEYTTPTRPLTLPSPPSDGGEGRVRG
ncbi:MAG TPA: ABC transporter transmembrane domain-containing protein, partial [Gemmataceae bacterium]|nr:ABC transporter transmembrane domain-containing protein [Gemmataceae bacterium]